MSFSPIVIASSPEPVSADPRSRSRSCRPLALDPPDFDHRLWLSSFSQPSSSSSSDVPAGLSAGPGAALATLALPPGMGTGLDAPEPLNARRPAAPPLPTFELPQPGFSASQHHPHLPPPTATAAPGAPAVISSPESSHWGSYSGGAGRQPWTQTLGSSYSSRDPFSPSVNPLHRNPAQTPGADPTTYDMNQLPPFHQPLGSTPAPHSGHPMLSSQPQPQPLPSNDPYITKSSSAPAYGGVQQLASPPGYQAYPPGPGPGPPGPPGPPLMHHPPRVASNPPHLGYQRQPWPSYSLPAMAGPVMSNVHSPGGQMSLMNPQHQPGLLPGFSSGHVASMQQMYGGHPPHPLHGAGAGAGVGGPTNDRPFKCDKCPQSFNRNHDLKRHSRIHLAVKPYPCHNCDKQFSRKDALKVFPLFPKA